MNFSTPRFLFIGFGAVGQGLAPLLVKALGIAPTQIEAWAADLKGAAVAQDVGLREDSSPVTTNMSQFVPHFFE